MKSVGSGSEAVLPRRKPGSITGLPDAYGRGCITGDCRLAAL